MKLNSYPNISYRFLPIHNSFMLYFNFIYYEYHHNTELFKSYNLSPNDLEEQNNIFLREAKFIRREV